HDQGRALPTELHGPARLPCQQSTEPTWRLERETGFEPATPSLEGWRSTAELFPPVRTTVVGRGGLEPPNACPSRFTVCPLWPLGYLPEPARIRFEPLENAGE